MQMDKDQPVHMGYSLRWEDDVLLGPALRSCLYLREASRMSITAMKQALEALENSVDLVQNEYAVAVELYGKYPTRAAKIDGLLALQKAHEDSITALRQAIEQAEFDAQSELDDQNRTPPTAPAQGLFTGMIAKHEGLAEELAAPAQPLTDEQIDAIHLRVSEAYDRTCEGYESHNFARAIEAHIKGASL